MALLAAVVGDFFTSCSALLRQRIRVVLLGLLCGVRPARRADVLLGVSGGAAPVNYAGVTVVLFPLSIGYAIVQHDLFAIDGFVKRSVYYLTLTALIGAACAVFLLLTDLSLKVPSFAHTGAFPLLFTLAVILLLSPLRDTAQHMVDRVFFRQRFKPREMLEILERAASLDAATRGNRELRFADHRVHGRRRGECDCGARGGSRRVRTAPSGRRRRQS